MIKQFAKGILQSPKTYRAVEKLEASVPFLRQWHRMQYQRHFHKIADYERIFSGVYPDFATAQSHIPKDRPVGYDNQETATFLGREAPLQPSEYPVIFWLSQLLRENATLFDFGGYLGLLYNAYQRFKIFPDDLLWTVYDVPAVVAAGEAILKAEPDSQLRFTTSFEEASSASILLAAGAVHFCEEGFGSMLSRLKTLPTHLLINKLPATDGSQSFTLNNMGPAISPYKIANRAEFIASIESLGYKMIDRWKNPDMTCYIPFHPDRNVEAFDGFYFRLDDPK